MSAKRQSDHVRSDGDWIYGEVRIDQWQDEDQFMADLDNQVTAMRDEMKAEFERLQALSDAL